MLLGLHGVFSFTNASGHFGEALFGNFNVQIRIKQTQNAVFVYHNAVTSA